MIQFSDSVGFWSSFIFWYVFVNAIITVCFTLVIIVGGLVDLKYLLKQLRENTSIDETDDGRVSLVQKTEDGRHLVEKNRG